MENNRLTPRVKDVALGQFWGEGFTICCGGVSAFAIKEPQIHGRMLSLWCVPGGNHEAASKSAASYRACCRTPGVLLVRESTPRVCCGRCRDRSREAVRCGARGGGEEIFRCGAPEGDRRGTPRRRRASRGAG